MSFRENIEKIDFKGDFTIEVIEQIIATHNVELERIANDPNLLEVGRKAIEDELISFRDNRISMFQRNNGLVIREKDGKDSSIIRFGPEDALRIGIKAMAKMLVRKEKVR